MQLCCNSKCWHAGDDEGDEKIALALLCALLLKKGAPIPLVYIYEQCQVNNHYIILLYCPGSKTEYEQAIR